MTTILQATIAHRSFDYPLLARELVDGVIANLGRPRSELEDAIHDARTGLKRLRALLRLLAEELGGERFDAENKAYRDAGRALSGLRDAHVQLRTLKTFRLNGGDGAQAVHGAESLHASLKSECAELERRAVGDDQIVADVRGRLDAARERIGRWHIRPGFAAIRPGLYETYSSGRRSWRRCRRNPTSRNFHNWRKRVKDLLYQTEFLEPLWPRMMRAHRKELADLADILGEEHDLAVLETRASVDPQNVELTRLIRDRRAKLQRATEPLARRLYGEPSRRFVERVQTSWEAWEEDDRDAPAPASRTRADKRRAPRKKPTAAKALPSPEGI